MKPLPDYKPTRTIFGMIPWMFWTLLATVLFFLFAPFAAVLLRADQLGDLHEPDSNQAKMQFSQTSGTTISTLSVMSHPLNLSIAAGTGQIVINMNTGKVDLPKDMKLDDAAVAFWLRVAQLFPECRQAILTGDPTPLTTMWGDDYLAKYPDKTTNPIYGKVTHMAFIMIHKDGAPSYEFGLRSDGVVVWREVKP